MRNEEQAQRRRDKITMYKATFGTEAGQAVMKDLEHFCFFNTTTFDENQNTMIMREGARNVYLYIKSIIEKQINS
jgi:hypothetical protein